MTIGFDTETHLIKPGCAMPRMVCASFAGKGFKPGGELFTREEGLDVLEQRIDQHERITAHHSPYDFGVAAAERQRLLPKTFAAIDRGDITCTKIREMMIANARGELKFEWDEEEEKWKARKHFTVQNLSWQYLKKFRKKGEDTYRLRYNEMDGLPVDQYPEDARKYAIEDAVDHLAIHQNQNAGKPLHGEVGQMQAAWALHLIGGWGVRTDPVAVEKLKGELSIEYARYAEICVKHGFLRAVKTKSAKAGSRDMKAVRAAIESWYKSHGRKPKLTEKGQIATDREQLTDTDHPGLRAVADAVKTQKLLTTYVPVLESGTIVPITASYNPIVETYRTSCGKPNLQNPPRKGAVRACFIPREGSVFAFCDYDTLEMMTLGQVLLDFYGQSSIADAANAGVDFHVALAAQILGMGYREAMSLYKAGDKNIENVRQYCKIANYGFGGGMGAEAFVNYAKGYGIIVSLERAQKLRDGYRRTWLEMPQFFTDVGNLCDSAGGVAERIVFPRSGLVRGQVSYTAACNGYFQHPAAMGAKDALYHVVKECYIDGGSPLYGCRPWLFAHDEIGMEIPIAAIGPKRAHDASMRLREVMIERMKHWNPSVPINATVVMCRRWFKGAKAVLLNGLLVPSKPEEKKWVADV